MAPIEVKIKYVCVKILLSTEMSFVLSCFYHPPSVQSGFYDQLKLLLNNLTIRK